MPLSLVRRCSIVKSYFRNLSLAASESSHLTSRTHESFRCSTDDPTLHDKCHIGQLYKIDPELTSKLFQKISMPKSFFEQCQVFRETRLMVRKPALEIIHYLKTANLNNPLLKFILYGKVGCGKTMTSFHLLHYGHASGWLVIHVPWLVKWFWSKTEVTDSFIKPNMVDINSIGLEWLQYFKTQNAALLTKLDVKLENDYEWNVRESSKKGDDLMSLINYGIERANYSSKVISALFTEVKVLSKNNKIKTLIVIDGINALFHNKTNLRNSLNKVMEPTNVTMVHPFLDLLKSDWHNSAAILTVDQLASPGAKASELPFDLLKQKGFDRLFPFIPIEVSEMTREESMNILDYYRDRLWLRDEKADEELIALSGGNGFQLMRLAGPL